MSRARQEWQEPPSPQQFGSQFSFPPLTPVVKWLLKVNFGIFVGMWLLFLISTPVAVGLQGVLALDPVAWRNWFPFVPIWQLFTHGFVHSLQSPGHVFWNMLQLYFFGTMLESIIGGRRFMAAYLGAMLAGAVVQMLVS